MCVNVISITVLVILACSKTFFTKTIPENHTRNWLWYIYVDFIAKEMRPWNSPKLNPLDYYIWKYIQGQSQIPSKTEYIVKLK